MEMSKQQFERKQKRKKKCVVGYVGMEAKTDLQ